MPRIDLCVCRACPVRVAAKSRKKEKTIWTQTQCSNTVCNKIVIKIIYRANYEIEAIALLVHLLFDKQNRFKQIIALKRIVHAECHIAGPVGDAPDPNPNGKGRIVIISSRYS